MTDTAVDLFKRRRAAGLTSVLIFYRGERSFFCRQWLRRWLTIPALDRRLELADVALLFTTSQSQGKAFSVAEQIAGHHPLLDRRIFFFGDPEHLLVNYLVESGLSKPVITNPDSHRAHGWVFDYGMVQPAIVAVARDAAIIYDWTTKPTILNVAGKLDRPDPWDVWDRIERRLDRIRITNARAARAANQSNVPFPRTQQLSHPSHHSLPPNHPIANTAQRFDSCPSPPPSIPVTKRLQSVPAHSASVSPRVPRHRHFVDDTFAPTTFPRSPVQPDSDSHNAPLSTSIDTFVDTVPNATLLREDLDVSDSNLIANVPIHDLSARINALASDLLLDQPQSSATEPRTDQLSVQPRSSSTYQPLAMPQQYRPTTPSRLPTSTLFRPSPSSRSPCREPMSSEMQMLSPSQQHSSRDNLDSDANRVSRRSTNLTKASSSSLLDGDLEPLYTDDVQSESLKPFRRFDLFERHSSATITEPLETSVASGGSDQVDSTAVTMKHASIRTDESSQFNSHHFDSRTSFSSDRRIPEEADDRKSGVHDHLRDLKDPSLLAEVHPHSLNEEPRFNHDVEDDHSFRPIHEPQTLVMDEASLEVTATSVKPSDPENRELTSILTPLKPIIMASRTTPNLSSPSEVENSIPLTKSMIGRVSSPYREVKNIFKPIASNISPFADAESDLEVPKDSITRTSLRDEYEAYDEYIVCEYEVEEQVEEYDSDALSRSRGFLKTCVQEGRAPPRSSSAKDLGSDSSRTRFLELHGPNVKAEQDRRKGNTLAAMASEPTLTPGLEAQELEWRQGASEASTTNSQVRRVLRKIKVPIMAVRRKVVGKGQKHEGLNVDDGTGASGEGESSRARRKETMKTVLRKRPGGFKAGEGISGFGRGDDGFMRNRDDYTDDQSARVARKETIRAVLRRIPMPKNRRRASTGETTSPIKARLEDDVRGEGWRQRDRSAAPSKTNSAHSKTGPLQAVLQRLPSLSSSRDRRVNLMRDMSSNGDIIRGRSEYREFVAMSRSEPPGSAKRVEAIAGTDAYGSTRGGIDAESTERFRQDMNKRSIQDEHHVGHLKGGKKKEEMNIPQSTLLHEESVLRPRSYYGDVLVKGSEGVGMNAENALSGHGMVEKLEAARQSKTFGRTLARLVGDDQADSEDGDFGDDTYGDDEAEVDKMSIHKDMLGSERMESTLPYSTGHISSRLNAA